MPGRSRETRRIEPRCEAHVRNRWVTCPSPRRRRCADWCAKEFRSRQQGASGRSTPSDIQQGRSERDVKCQTNEPVLRPASPRAGLHRPGKPPPPACLSAVRWGTDPDTVVLCHQWAGVWPHTCAPWGPSGGPPTTHLCFPHLLPQDSAREATLVCLNHPIFPRRLGASPFQQGNEASHGTPLSLGSGKPPSFWSRGEDGVGQSASCLAHSKHLQHSGYCWPPCYGWSLLRK